MEELTAQIVGGLESSEGQTIELQSLDDATLDPSAYIERAGDYQQAEAIQNSVVALISSVPQSIDSEQLEYEPGPVKQPPDWDHGTPPDPVTVVLEDPNTVLGRQPKMIDDLSELKPANTGDDGIDEAADDWETPVTTSNEPGAVSEDSTPTPSHTAGKPQEPLRQANYQKPILHKELTDKGVDIGSLDDLDSLIPGRGEIGGFPGSEDPFGSIFGDLYGLGGLGFDGGPQDLTNDPGGDNSDPSDLFGPGGGPPAPQMMGDGGGRNIFWSWNFNPQAESRYQASKELTEMDENISSDEPLTYDPAWEAVPKSEQMDPFDDITPATSSDYDEHEKEMTAFTEAQIQQEEERQKQEEARRKRQGDDDTECEDEYAGGQTAPSEEPNPKYDQSHISLTTEDQTSGGQTDGHLTQQGQEALERVQALRGRLAHARKKDGAELVTDPPEHDPKKGSEAAG